MLKLYHAPTSVCSQKVRVGLAEIGLDYVKCVDEVSPSAKSSVVLSRQAAR